MCDSQYIHYLKTPVGILKISTGKVRLIAIDFVEKKELNLPEFPEIMRNTIQQLCEYFEGNRTDFQLNLHPHGTDFQIKTWNEVIKIPYGETSSYLEIAKLTGSAKNTRAVGLANGKNPIPIVIPCHRVIGTNGKLTGYAGGIERKKWLLQHELKNKKHTSLLF